MSSHTFFVINQSNGSNGQSNQNQNSRPKYPSGSNVTPHPNDRQYNSRGYPILSNAELMNQLMGNPQPKTLQPQTPKK
jgi:hypothetical protein